MIGEKDFKRQQQIMACLSSLPRKMLSVYELDNVPEFILHDMCSEHCFNLIRAAYFVDNPDFNSCKGVAGFCRTEAYNAGGDLWQQPENFSKFMGESPFNQKVRSIVLESILRNKRLYDHVTQKIAPQLGFSNPAWCTWHLKYFNEGFIVFEKGDLADELFDQHFINTLHLLGFCAIR